MYDALLAERDRTLADFNARLDVLYTFIEAGHAALVVAAPATAAEGD